MAVTDQQKLDFLLKKIGFTKTKTGSTVGTGAISGTPKQPFAEAIPSPLVVPNSSLWNEADSIPTTPPGSDTNQVKVYSTTSAIRMTADVTSSGNRAYIAYSTYNNTSSPRLTNWIDTQFGSLYLIKVFKNDPTVPSNALSAGATNENWFFDYSAGVLNFNDTNVPTHNDIYIVGYRYIGQTGAPTAGISTFSLLDLSVQRNLDVGIQGGISTFRNNIDLNADLDVSGVSTFSDNIFVGTGATVGFGSTAYFNHDVVVASDKSLSIGGKLSTKYFSNLNSVFQSNTAGQFISISDSFTLQALNGKKLFKAGISGDTGLYHQGTQKLGTNVNGISILNNATGALGTMTALDVNTSFLNVSGNSVFSGISTFTDIDVDGHTNLDNVSISGVTTFSGRIVGSQTNNVIPFYYDNLGQLPSASTYHGAFAHVHTTGRAYFAHAGWKELVNREANGVVGTGTEAYNIGNINAVDGTFSGNVSIAGTLTYEDVKNVDAVGLITARSGIRVTGGVIEAQAGENKIPSLYSNLTDLPSASTYHGLFAHVHSTGRGYYSHANNWYELVRKELTGVVGTGTETYYIGDLDVDGHTNLDNVSVSGMTTHSGYINVANRLYFDYDTGTKYMYGSGTDLNTFIGSSGDWKLTLNASGGTNGDFIVEKSSGTTLLEAKGTGVVNIFGDLDVDGHTNLDNVSISGVTTFAGNIGGTATFNDIDVDGHTNLDNVSIAGVTTFQGVIDAKSGQNKISFLYNDQNDLPSPSTYHGMFAHVHNVGRGYFAHAGGWYELVNREFNGVVGTGTEGYNIGFVDIGSNIQLGNTGVVTATNFVGGGSGLTGVNVTALRDSGGNIKIQANESGAVHTGISTFQDIDVSGVSTFSDNIFVGTGATVGFGSTAYFNGGTLRFEKESNGITIEEGGGSVLWKHGPTHGTNQTSFGYILDSAFDYWDDIFMVLDQSSRFQIGSSGVIQLGSESGAGVWLRADSTSTRLYHSANYTSLANDIRLETSGVGVTVYGRVDATQLNISGISTFTDIDVDGHTNLDNVSVAGVTTFTGDAEFDNDAKFDGSMTAGGTAGINGQYLKTTGNGVAWASFPTMRTKQTSTASAGQTTFSFSYNVGFLDVYVNGVKLSDAEFTATNGSAVILAVGCFVGDIVELVSFNTVSGGGGSGSAGITIQDEGSSLPTVTTALDFVGDGVVASGTGSTKTITINAGVDTSQFNVNKLNISGISTFNGNIDVNADIDVDGHTELDNVNIAGVVTASDIRSDSLEFKNAAGGQSYATFSNGGGATLKWNNTDRLETNSNGVNVTGTVNATAFVGDGSGLSGISAGVTVQDEGSSLSTSGTILNFVGSGVVASGNGSTKTITIAGGASQDTFKTIAVSGQSDVVADNSTDTLTLVAGSNMTITTNATSDTITFAASSGTGVSIDSYRNTFAGTDTGISLTVNSTDNTFFGYNAGRIVNSGDKNTLIGAYAGDTISTGNNNTAVGQEALQNSNGNDNVAIGKGAGYNATTGNKNTFVGENAGYTSNGSNSTCLGQNAGANGTNNHAIAIGDRSLWLGGTDTVAIGQNTLTRGAQTGSIGIGYYAGYNNDADYSIYIGYESGYGQSSVPYTTGENNVGIGYQSLYSIISGEKNTALGRKSGYSLTTGSNNIIIGNDAEASSASASNEITFGDTAITKFRIPGINFVLKDNGGTPTQGHVLTVDSNGEASFAAATGGGGGGANVGITTGLVGTFNATGGVATIDSFVYHNDDKVVEYTVYIKNGSDFQTQKLLVMRDGTTIHSTQFAVMFSSSLLVQLDATISPSNINLRATPESGVTGSTSYRIKREVM